MMKNKTKEQRTAIIKGFVALIIGLIIGIAYLGKFFPMNSTEHLALLTVWSTFGWVLSAIAIVYGLCEIFIKGDL